MRISDWSSDVCSSDLIAETCEFEEIAHLLVHGKLPNKAELAAYKEKLRSLRGLPASLQTALDALPAASHPMDVMRTAVSVLGCVLPEKDDHNLPDARDIARSEEHTSELQSLMPISYAVFCLN